jgi:hypothetical protein
MSRLVIEVVTTSLCLSVIGGEEGQSREALGLRALLCDGRLAMYDAQWTTGDGWSSAAAAGPFADWHPSANQYPFKIAPRQQAFHTLLGIRSRRAENDGIGG